jgi:hypothetical protein
MTEAEWQSFVARLEVQEFPDWRYPPLPSAQVVAKVEQSMGIAFPESYKRWACTFGAGELGGYFRIATPMEESSPFEIRQFDSQWRGSPDDDLWSGQIDAGFLSTTIWFAETIGGESYVWQLSESTDSQASEYRIYFIPRHRPPRPCADSFFDWLVNVALKGDEAQGWKPEWCFSRFAPG